MSTPDDTVDVTASDDGSEITVYVTTRVIYTLPKATDLGQFATHLTNESLKATRLLMPSMVKQVMELKK